MRPFRNLIRDKKKATRHVRAISHSCDVLHRIRFDKLLLKLCKSYLTISLFLWSVLCVFVRCVYFYEVCVFLWGVCIFEVCVFLWGLCIFMRCVYFCDRKDGSRLSIGLILAVSHLETTLALQFKTNWIQTWKLFPFIQFQPRWIKWQTDFIFSLSFKEPFWPNNAAPLEMMDGCLDQFICKFWPDPSMIDLFCGYSINWKVTYK